MDQFTHYREHARSTFSNALSWRIPHWAAGLTLAALYAVLWLIRRTYSGLDDDAHLYAFQALARFNPQFATGDLFLAYGSQDQYTLFTPGYAWLIAQVGLAPAEAALTTLFHLWSAVAAWFIVRRFSSTELSWLAVGVFIMMPGAYGSHGVFEYAESFLTARLPAEALVLSAIALFVHGKKIAALSAIGVAMLIHPIIAAPGMLLLLLLAIPKPWRNRLIFAGIAVGILLLAAAAARWLPVPIIDEEWLSVIRARTFFMFVETWNAAAWDWTFLTLLTLLFATLTSPAGPRRDLFCMGAIVGASGLLLAGTTSFIPIELLIQGQPWRWMWLATCLAVLSMVLTTATCSSADPIARHACLLLIAAWVFPVIWAFPNMIATPIAVTALLIYRVRDSIPIAYAKYVRILSIGVFSLAIFSALLSASSLVQLDFTTNRESAFVERARDILALAFPGILIAWFAWFLTIRQRTAIAAVALTTFAAAVAAAMAPRVHAQWSTTPYDSAYRDFEPWRAAIDNRRNVLWANNPVGAWLLLNSPSYLSTSQTAGVVFSRRTAMEAKRRAEVLAPLVGYSTFALQREQTDSKIDFTQRTLRQICMDPLLGYVVSTEVIDIPHLRAPKGRWENENLYSCDLARNSGT